MPASNANPLTKRSFFAALSILALCLAAANSAVAFLTRHTLPRQSMAMIKNSSGAKVVLLGNSLLVAGFDAAEFNARLQLQNGSKEALNLAMTSTGPIEHLLFLRYALAHGTAPCVVIYGFIGLQMSDPIVLANRDLIGKREVLYYLEPEYARRFYTMSSRDSAEFQIMRRSAMLSERSAVWGKIERLRRKLSAQGLPAAEENSLGRVADFNRMESPDSAGFALQVTAATNAPLNPPVEEILRESAKSGARIVVVEMPVTSMYRRKFYDTGAWMKYRAHVQSVLAGQNATYINASDWVADDSLFQDYIHLNSAGATVFSSKLGEILKQQLAVAGTPAPTCAKKP
jgi:hypothetical protein